MPHVVAVDLVISCEYNFKSSRENLCVYPMVRLCTAIKRNKRNWRESHCLLLK